MIRVVVMGVSGAGKSAIAHALAAAMGWPLVEGDALHPPENIAKMSRGEPLDDDDRRPFLQAIGNQLAAAPAPGVIATCSALRRAYRDQLRAQAGELLFVQLQVSRAELQRRLAARTEHFMPASLLESQLATLEPLQVDEPGLIVDGEIPLEQLVTLLRAALVQKPKVRTKLLAIYRAAHYCVAIAGADIRLVVDEPCAALQAAGVMDAALLTACNPRSCVMDHDWNRLAQQRLISVLQARGRQWHAANSRDPSGAWPEEPGCFIPAIQLADAHELARQFGQLAFLWTGRDAIPRLVETAAATAHLSQPRN